MVRGRCCRAWGDVGGARRGVGGRHVPPWQLTSRRQASLPTWVRTLPHCTPDPPQVADIKYGALAEVEEALRAKQAQSRASDRMLSDQVRGAAAGSGRRATRCRTAMHASALCHTRHVHPLNPPNPIPAGGARGDCHRGLQVDRNPREQAAGGWVGAALWAGRLAAELPTAEPSQPATCPAADLRRAPVRAAPTLPRPLLPQASDRERLTHLEDYLHQRVVGQEAGA